MPRLASSCRRTALGTEVPSPWAACETASDLPTEPLELSGLGGGGNCCPAEERGRRTAKSWMANVLLTLRVRKRARTGRPTRLHAEREEYSADFAVLLKSVGEELHCWGLSC